MKRTSLRRRATLRAAKRLKRRTPLRSSPSLAASEAQRVAVTGRACIVCGTTAGPIEPAHLIPRSLGACGDVFCVVPLCRHHHRAYDPGELDLLPYLEPAWRAQLAHAVAHLGLIGALRSRWRTLDGGASRDRSVVGALNAVGGPNPIFSSQPRCKPSTGCK